MKKFLPDPVSLPRYFKVFVAVTTLLSVLGGYLLSHLMYGTNDFYLQHTEKLLAMQGNLDDAAITLGRQIQEWKDMLLRVNETDLYSKHRQAFLECSKGVQEALMRTKTAMQNNGMDTGEIESLLTEHQLLLSDYLLARIMLNPGRADSYHEVDAQIIGIDRNLQRHIASVRADIETFSREQLSGTSRAQRDHFLLIGLLGTLSLLIMSLAGVVFAGYFQGNKSGRN